MMMVMMAMMVITVMMGMMLMEMGLLMHFASLLNLLVWWRYLPVDLPFMDSF